MRKVLHIAILWVAGLLLLTHSVVPHIHHASLADKEVCDAHSTEDVIDFLAKVFHNDLGFEHLEHFQIQNTTDAQPIAVFASIELPEYFEIAEIQKPVAVPNNSLPPDEPLILCSGLRGPPTV